MILRAFVLLVLLFLILPIAVIALFSFHETPSLNFPFTGFSLRWYAELSLQPEFRATLLKSLIIATAVSIVVLIFGTLAALAWLRLDRRLKSIVEFVTITPIALPGLFVGVALLVMFDNLGVPLSTITIVIAHVVIALPLMIVAIRARLELFDRSLEDASRDLGAGLATTFVRITLPIIAPTLIAGAIMAFAVSFDEFVVTLFVAGIDNTVPMYVWSVMRRTISPVINAVSTLALFLSLLSLFAVWVVGHVRRRTSLSRREDR